MYIRAWMSVSRAFPLSLYCTLSSFFALLVSVIQSCRMPYGPFGHTAPAAATRHQPQPDGIRLVSAEWSIQNHAMRPSAVWRQCYTPPFGTACQSILVLP